MGGVFEVGELDLLDGGVLAIVGKIDQDIIGLDVCKDLAGSQRIPNFVVPKWTTSRSCRSAIARAEAVRILRRSCIENPFLTSWNKSSVKYS